MSQSLKHKLIYLPILTLSASALLWAGSLQPKIENNTKTSQDALIKSDIILNEIKDLSVNVGILSQEVINIKEHMGKLENLLIDEIKN